MKHLKLRAKRSISSHIIRVLLMTTILAGIAIFITISGQQIYTYHNFYEQLHEKEFHATDTFIRELVMREVKYIERRRIAIEHEQEKNIKQSVEEAEYVARLVYEKYKDTKSKEEIRDMIVKIFEGFSFPVDQSNIYINTLDGVGVWYSNNPSFEGRDLRDTTDSKGNPFVNRELELLSKQDSGYIRYYNQQEIGSSAYVFKITYIKAFPELDWYFIAKCYPETYFEDFKKEIAEKVHFDDFVYDGHSFAVEASGQALSTQGKVFTPENPLNLKGNENPQIRATFQKCQKLLTENPTGCFADIPRYVNDSTIQNTHAYIAYYAPSNLVIGSAYSPEKLEDSLQSHKKRLQVQIIMNIFIILVVSLIAFALQYFYGNLFAHHIQHDFNEFLKFFQSAKKSHSHVHADKLYYTETQLMAHTANEMIDELSQSICDMKAAEQRAIKSDRLKSAFLANISHEIRTPMNAIVGFSDLLNEDLTDKEKAELIDLIKESGHNLLDLIENIIDTAKMETGDVQITKKGIDIYQLLHQAEAHINKQIKKSGKSIVFQTNYDIPYPECIYTDGKRLAKALNHVLDNAVKFTKKGTVQLEVSQHNHKLFFQVNDTGIGISEENQQIIFNRFIRIEDMEQNKNNLTRSDRGIGTGLAICKSVVQALGGEIAVASTKLNEGSSFLFFVDIKRE